VPPFSSQNTATPSWFHGVQPALFMALQKPTLEPTIGGTADFALIYRRFGDQSLKSAMTARQFLTKISCPRHHAK
jgi:hypothetical protein